MPGSMDKSSAGIEKWVRFKLRTPPELAEALSNYLTEMGAQGVFEEFLQPGDRRARCLFVSFFFRSFSFDPPCFLHAARSPEMI